ncbi:MAG: hypothetical protein JST36_08950 [Bacteroidetes bacterium]|nr:hypothetical protein [Bacteroidota bacterium]
MSLFRQSYLATFAFCSVFFLGTSTLHAQVQRDPIDPALVHPSQQAAKVDYKLMGAAMPEMRVVYPKKGSYTEHSFQNKANLFVMLFNPTCEHCEAMARDMAKHIDLFKQSQIVLMAAPMMVPYLEYFENTTKVQNFPKIKYGVDSAEFINKTFTYEGLPQVNIYNADRKLIKTYTGLENIDSLKAYIQ